MLLFSFIIIKGEKISYDVSVDIKGDIIANIKCQNQDQKLRVGDIHNQDNVTLVCDQPTKTWALISMSNKVYKLSFKL